MSENSLRQHVPRQNMLRTALADPEFYQRDLMPSARNALTGLIAGSVGAPVDLATMAMKPFGYSVPPEQVVGSSEWLGERLGANVDSLPFLAGSIGVPDPKDLAAAGVGVMRLFRAHSGDDLTKIRKGSHWSPDEDVASSYTNNPGFGGSEIRAAQIPDDVKILDVGDVHNVSGLERVARALDYDDPTEVAREWWDAGYRYPWEESGEVLRRLEASGYDFLRYVDDFPEGADTLRALREFDLGG